MKTAGTYSVYPDVIPQRVERYRRQARHFRQLAESEPSDKLRSKLLDLADQYEVIADSFAAKALTIIDW